jgi:hypothetical protein
LKMKSVIVLIVKRWREQKKWSVIKKAKVPRGPWSIHQLMSWLWNLSHQLTGWQILGSDPGNVIFLWRKSEICETLRARLLLHHFECQTHYLGDEWWRYDNHSEHQQTLRPPHCLCTLWEPQYGSLSLPNGLYWKMAANSVMRGTRF